MTPHLGSGQAAACAPVLLRRISTAVQPALCRTHKGNAPTALSHTEKELFSSSSSSCDGGARMMGTGTQSSGQRTHSCREAPQHHLSVQGLLSPQVCDTRGVLSNPQCPGVIFQFCEVADAISIPWEAFPGLEALCVCAGLHSSGAEQNIASKTETQPVTMKNQGPDGASPRAGLRPPGSCLRSTTPALQGLRKPSFSQTRCQQMGRFV